MNLRPIKIHNNLAEAKYSLNTSEQKLFIYAVRNLNQENEDFVESEFRLINFAEFSGLEITRLYKDIETMTENLMKTVIKIKDKKDKNNDKWLRFNLTRRCSYDKGNISFVFNDDMKPILLQLQEHYFLQSPGVMKFTSQHSIRIYDLLKAHSYSNQNVIVELDRLKELLELEGKYSRVSSFKDRVIDVAVDEINSCSDIKVKYTNVYHGRKIKSLDFFVQRELVEKSSFGQMYDLDLYREKIGLSDAYSDSHIEVLYETAINKYTTYSDMDDIFLYMKMCYEYTKSKNPTDEFSYYKDVLSKDYSNFISKINSTYPLLRIN